MMGNKQEILLKRQEFDKIELDMKSLEKKWIENKINLETITATQSIDY